MSRWRIFITDKIFCRRNFLPTDFLPIRYEEIIVEVTEGVMRLLLEKVTHIKCHAMPLKLKVMLISCSYQSYAHIAHLIKGLARVREKYRIPGFIIPGWFLVLRRYLYNPKFTKFTSSVIIIFIAISKKRFTIHVLFQISHSFCTQQFSLF